MNWEFSLNIENEMGNSRKEGSSHFNLNMNDWDIQFPKVPNDLGKTLSIEGNGMKPLEILPIPQLFFIFSGLCLYHSQLSQDFVNNYHFVWEIYVLLDKNSK